MSAEVISRDVGQNGNVRLVPKGSAVVSSRADSNKIRSQDRVLGLMGTVVVAVVLALSVYSVVKYLL